MIVRPLVPVSVAVTAAAEALAYIERRFAKRKAVATNALIISPDISAPIACMVRDISSTGARLELVQSVENPLGGRAKFQGRSRSSCALIVWKWIAESCGEMGYLSAFDFWRRRGRFSAAGGKLKGLP